MQSVCLNPLELPENSELEYLISKPGNWQGGLCIQQMGDRNQEEIGCSWVESSSSPEQLCWSLAAFVPLSVGSH